MKKYLLLAFLCFICACQTVQTGEDAPCVVASKTIPVSKLKITVLEEKALPVKKEKPKAYISYLAETVYFADGSAAIDAVSKANLRQLAYFAGQKKASITVYGYASSRTKDTSEQEHKLINFNISYQRAQNVVDVLLRAGLKPQNISFEALSDSAPVYAEVMPKNESKNRRAEIFVSFEEE